MTVRLGTTMLISPGAVFPQVASEAPLESSEWQAAEEDVRSATKVFHAEVAQVSARYAEADFQARNAWSLQLDRRPSRAGEPVAAASPAPWLQG